jgi:type II secretory pathway pseudopilin PulG
VLGNTKKLLHKETGFTVPELIISITIIAVISVSLLAIITNYFATMTRNNLLIDMTVNSQNLLRATVEQLRYGAGVRQTNTITDPNAPSGWNTSNSAFVIIIAVPAVDASNNYIIDPDTGEPYNNELVYFKQGTDLYRRTLAHPDATGNKLKTSCPESSASSTCPADIKLIEDLQDMIFTLYDQDNAITTDPVLARSVQINLTMVKNTFGGPLTLENSTRMTLRNQF